MASWVEEMGNAKVSPPPTQIDRIEAKLDTILSFIAEMRPVIQAAAEMQERMSQGGMMATMQAMFRGSNLGGPQR